MLNVVVLMGRLVADPELRHTPNGVAVTSIRLAVDRSYAKAGAERQTDFIDVTAWRGTAEFVSRYFSKGSMIAVQGALHVDNYTDREGNKRTRYEVLADNVSFCGSRRESGGSDASYAGSAPSSPAPYRAPEAPAAAPSAPAAPAAASAAPAAPAYSNGDMGDFQSLPDDDDLPF